MSMLTFANKTYAVDSDEYLSDFNAWEENFARAMAPKVGIISGLSEDHWRDHLLYSRPLQENGEVPAGL